MEKEYRRRRWGRHLLLGATFVSLVSLPVSAVSRDWPATIFFGAAVTIGALAVHTADRADARSYEERRPGEVRRPRQQPDR